MATCSFKNYLTTYTGLPESYFMGIFEGLTKKVYKKGAFLLRPGERCNSLFFVEKGLIRYYSIDNKGKEHILQFAPEGWFTGDRESVFYNQPSIYHMQALEESEVILLDEKWMKELIETQEPALAKFNNLLLHNHIRQLQKRINLLLSATAEERYLDFMNLYPDIMMRVPQLMVASYLGITPESLSRVRKEMAARQSKK